MQKFTIHWKYSLLYFRYRERSWDVQFANERTKFSQWIGSNNLFE